MCKKQEDISFTKYGGWKDIASKERPEGVLSSHSLTRSSGPLNARTVLRAASMPVPPRVTLRQFSGWPSIELLTSFPELPALGCTDRVKIILFPAISGSLNGSSTVAMVVSTSRKI